MLTIADEGGRGGLKTPKFAWRNMGTAPKAKNENAALCFAICAILPKARDGSVQENVGGPH